MYMWLVCVCFSNCFRLSSNGSVIMCLSNCSQRYCSAVIYVSFTCLLFLVSLVILSLLLIWCMICHCGYGHHFFLLSQGSMVCHSCQTATVDPIGVEAYFLGVSWFSSISICLLTNASLCPSSLFNQLVVY